MCSPAPNKICGILNRKHLDNSDITPAKVRIIFSSINLSELKGRGWDVTQGARNFENSP